VNTLAGILHHPLTHRIGWALLHSLWQGALVGAVFALLRFALRRRSANARYVAGCLSLGLLSAFPVVTVLVGSLPSAAPGSESPVISAFRGAAAPVFSFGDLQSSHAGHAAPSLGHRGPDILGQVVPLLGVAWFLGVAFFSARLTRSCWWVRTIRLRGNEPLAPEWMETLNDLRRRLGVSRPVRLLKSALVEVPTVIGWFRPVILLPAATLCGLTPGQLEAILAHELAHVRRWDYVVNACQCLVETLMFYHPVVWWISRCIREERENCCDDLVVEVCGDRLAYARALAAIEGFRGGPSELAFAASGGSLLNRIRRLLGVSNDKGPASGWQVAGLAFLGIGLVAIVLGIRLAVGSHPISVTFLRWSETPVFPASAPGLNQIAAKVFGTNTLAFRVPVAMVTPEIPPANGSRAVSQDVRAVEQAWANPTKRELQPPADPSDQTNLAYAGQGRQAMLAKLNRIRLDSVSFDGVPLSEVVLFLNDEAKKRDPEKRGVNFVLNQNIGGAATALQTLGPDGQLIPPAPLEQVDMSSIIIKINPALTDIRLADVLEAIVKVADKPIKYSIEDYCIVFSLRGLETTPLYVRTFKVDTNAFLAFLSGLRIPQPPDWNGVGRGIEVIEGSPRIPSPSPSDGERVPPTTLTADSPRFRILGLRRAEGTAGTSGVQGIVLALMNYLARLGVDLDPIRNPGKAMFYADRRGMLVVRATLQDLDIIERVIAELNATPPGEPSGSRKTSPGHSTTNAPQASFHPVLITTPGTNTSPDGVWRVVVSAAGDSLDLSRYRSSKGEGWAGASWTTSSPQKWTAHAGWFVFIESESRVWAYDGDRSLLLLAATADSATWYGPSRFPGAVPGEVSSRLSQAAREAIEPGLAPRAPQQKDSEGGRSTGATPQTTPELSALFQRAVPPADTPRVGFIREEKTVALDDKGSQLEFIQAKDGRLSWRVTWTDEGPGRESLAMDHDGFFKGTGWFAYVESPGRIWLFDGIRDLDLVQRGRGRYSVVAKDVFGTCPKQVLDALPDSARKALEELHKSQGPADRSVTPDSKAGSNDQQTGSANPLRDAYVLYELGQFGAAEQKLQAVLQKAPEDAAAAYLLSLVHEAQHRRESGQERPWGYYPTIPPKPIYR
jgi:beta-lactamase regulating signal transducer with metallopeptidase domain